MFCLTQFLPSKFSNTVESQGGLKASEVTYSQVTSHDDTASSFQGKNESIGVHKWGKSGNIFAQKCF